MIAAPAGSVTADHDIVAGTVTLAPLTGPSGVGAGGAAAAIPPTTMPRATITAAANIRHAAQILATLVEVDTVPAPLLRTMEEPVPVAVEGKTVVIESSVAAVEAGHWCRHLRRRRSRWPERQ